VTYKIIQIYSLVHVGTSPVHIALDWQTLSILPSSLKPTLQEYLAILSSRVSLTRTIVPFAGVPG